MEENEKPTSTDPLHDSSAANEPPTQPGERLRKILNSRLEESGPRLPSETAQTPSVKPEDASTIPGNIPLSPESQTGTPAGQGATEPMPGPSVSPFTYSDLTPNSPSQTDRSAAESTQPSAPVPPFTQGIGADQNFGNAATRPSTTWESNAQTIPPAAAPNAPYTPRVDQVDVNATRVTPAAYQSGGIPRPQQGYPRPAARSGTPVPSQRAPFTTQKPVAQQRPPYPPQPPQHSAAAMAPSKPRANRNTAGCLLRVLVVIMFIVTVVIVLSSAFAIYEYFSIASTLPSVEDLQKKASQFETTRILDRNGNLLYEILDPNAGRRTYVTLDKISPYLIAATLATEDKDFYSHPGFDPVALIRSLWLNYTVGEAYSGASTITQQLARTLLLSPTERSQRTVQRKAREIVLAAEITRRYSKEEILELYLNENYYGNMSYGIQAAAETYFSTSASKLTLGQSAFLAGLPQAPAVYDVFTNKDQTLDRFKTVVQLMFTLSSERNCINVSTNVQPVCVDAVSATRGLDEIETYKFVQAKSTFKDPHWVTYVRSLLEQQYDPQTIYRSGFTVYTTLDPTLQDQAEKIVKAQISTLAAKKVSDGALVAIRPSTGEILAMVGSADFYNDKIAGQVNMAVSPRQPGSSIKPLTYVAAFEKGWTPATVIWDVPSEFPPSGDANDTRAPYKPVNYDGKAHGPVSVRTALSNSFNVPAVKALQYIGVYSQGGLIQMARRMGITTLTRNDYGLALTLGGGEVTPLELTSAYSVFANGGRRMPPYAISKIVDYKGQTVFEYKQPAGEQVIRPEHAFLITSILSDNAARVPMYGTNSVINLPFQSAVKTGTTNDFRDNWTLGYTPDLAVGVWVGNADYTPMVDSSGVTGAGPIWADFMKFAVPNLTGGKPTGFTRPAGIVDRAVCDVSGTEPSEWCPKQRGEVFAYDQLPPSKDQDFWQKVTIDTWTGLKASPACGEFTNEKIALNVQDKWAVKWIKETNEGKAWADKNGFGTIVFFTPERECKLEDPHPKIVFSNPSDGQTVTTSPLDIYMVVDAPDFKDFQLSYGIGDNPVEMKKIGDPITTSAKDPTKVYSLDLKDIPPGKFTLQIRLNSSREGYYARKTIHLTDNVPTPTTTPTPTPTSTATPTFTPTASVTPSPTFTLKPPTATPTITNTLPPSATPTATKTATP